MNLNRGLWVGIAVLLILTGCSNKDKTLNVEGAYTPVIENLASDHEPPVRGIVNELTAVMQNPRGYPLTFHWSAGAGALNDSTAQAVHWVAPDSIGIYPVTVSVQAHDDLNNVDFFQTRTFQVYVDNEFERWTHSNALQLDVEPPVAGRIYYTEIRNTSTRESDIWSLASPLGTPMQVTHDFFQATEPTVRSDGAQVAFTGRALSTDSSSIWLVPADGGSPTTGSIASLFDRNTNRFLGSPRFARDGTLLAYDTDSLVRSAAPKPWVRDVGNFATPPVELFSNPGNSVTYTGISWKGSGDSVLVEGIFFKGASAEAPRGFFKLAATGTPPLNPSPPPVWILIPTASEPDWSPDGQHVVFTRRVASRTDRDLWIIRSDATDPSEAKRVTSGPSDDFHPRFSSDGSKIFFISNRADGYGTNGTYETERRGTNIWNVGRFDRP